MTNTIKILISVIAVLLAGLILVSIGAGAGSDSASVSTVTATVTAEPEPAAVVTAVPAECLAALDDADELIDISGRLTALTAQHLQDEGAMWAAFESIDMTGLDLYAEQMDEFTARIQELTTEVQSNGYATSRERCKAAAAN